MPAQAETLLRDSLRRPQLKTSDWGFTTRRIYCTPRAMWKLSWFLRDFDYDAELLAKNEIDGKALIDLWGVAKVSAVTINGASVLNFDGFAPAAKWEELSVFANADPRGSEVAS